jgi:hypothetical protein
MAKLFEKNHGSDILVGTLAKLRSYEPVSYYFILVKKGGLFASTPPFSFVNLHIII